ncbi:GNAT family N-acetyltransferase [Ornithinimicrobium pratense]|uniref:GNAT family N-acetyltransferase n=1 Tax=Ornithinimicrobium pratense TaxID=2593973 RepID=A0A5J6V8U6_9MICO|nr:GNAT family N-acetyltransferase [Ornithinimicrobium pratense]
MNDEPTLIDLTPDDLPRIKDLEDTVWFEVQPGGTPQDLADDLDFRHARAAERGGAPLPGEPDQERPPLAGMYSAYDLAVTVPGPGGGLTTLPMDGLTWVGVHPDARRKGLLTRLMRDHLHRIHDRGEAAVAGLHASEAAIYGRFGYGCASLDVKLELGRGSELKAPAWLVGEADRITTHVVTLPTPEGMTALHEAHLACAATALGAVTRPESKATTWYRDFPKSRGSKEPRRLMLARRNGTVTGYAVFRRESKWEDGSPRGEVSVAELGAVDLASLLALARRLLDLDLTSKVTLWARRLDDPLLWWAGGPRAAAPRIYDSLWIRVVDLPRALTDRGYAAACEVVLDVADELCPWNAGRWRLTVDGSGAATCVRTEDAADVELPVAALGAAYLGGRSLAAMVPALSGRELRSGAVRELSRAMRADVDPLGAIDF